MFTDCLAVPLEGGACRRVCRRCLWGGCRCLCQNVGLFLKLRLQGNLGFCLFLQLLGGFGLGLSLRLQFFLGFGLGFRLGLESLLGLSLGRCL